MNKPIIHTEFISNICFELYYTAYNIGIHFDRVTATWLSNNFNQAIDIVKQNISRVTNSMANIDDPADLIDLNDELESNKQLLIDLNILAELEGVNYAHPDHISNSINILSEKLTAQLDAKAHQEATYNSYYCKRLAECLKELCEILLD